MVKVNKNIIPILFILVLLSLIFVNGCTIYLPEKIYEAGKEIIVKTETEKVTVPEKETIIKKETIIQEIEKKGCVETDNGNDIWNRGICGDTSKISTDSCKVNFGTELFEYYCKSKSCTIESINCNDYAATCYEGACIKNNQDTDNDGFTDLDEYKQGTNPEDVSSFPGSGEPTPECKDTDGGKVYTKKGTCADLKDKKTDICWRKDYDIFVIEYWCNENNFCTQNVYDCSLLQAFCYDGECIRWDDDLDGDGWSNAHEYEHGTDVGDPNSHPQEGPTCNDICIKSGHTGGRALIGPYDICTAWEIAVSEAGLDCCCFPEPIPDIDTDGDGYTDAEEIEAGTDPNDSSDYPGSGEEPCESTWCSCSETGISFPERLKVVGTCQDECGTHMDECISSNILRNWYCAPTTNPKYCDYVDYGCVGNFGEGSYCSGGVCIVPEPEEPDCNYYADYYYFDFSSWKEGGFNSDSCYDYAQAYCANLGMEVEATSGSLDVEGCCLFNCNKVITSKGSNTETKQTGESYTFGTGSGWLNLGSGGGTGCDGYTLHSYVENGAKIQSTSAGSVTNCPISSGYSDTPWPGSPVDIGNWNEGSKWCLKKGNEYVLITNHDAVAPCYHPYKIKVWYERGTTS